MSLFRRPTPREVFTPGDLPIERGNVYVSRESSERLMKRGVERNRVPVVFGDYGVGKSSMVRRYFRDLQRAGWMKRRRLGVPREGQVVYFASSAGLTLPKVFERILEHLKYRVETEVTRSKTGESEMGFSGSRLTANRTTSRGKSSVSTLVVTAPTDEGILRIIDKAELTIIIDELHLASDAFRADLVPFIKASRLSAGNSNLVLIGTSADTLAIVGSDPGTDRYIQDTPVGSMAAPEARSLITDGFARLNVSIPTSLVDTTVDIASGAPTILQSLCLDMAERAQSENRREVVQDDLNTAVRQFIADKNARMTRKYLGAIETYGDRRYRKQILHAMSEVEGEYATMEDIRRAVSTQLNTEVPSSALSGPLQQLREPKYGSVLTDIERETGGRIQNMTSFSDPMMKSYVRFMKAADSAKVVPEEQAREAVKRGMADH